MATILSTSEIAQMRADALDLSESGSGMSVSLVLYRGATVLAAQSVRLVGGGGGGNTAGDGTESAQPGVSVVGSVTLNIQPRDRFNIGGVSYEVKSVQPNRYVQTTAHARSIQ